MYKKLFAWFLALMVVVPLAAQDYGYFTVKRADGREKSFAVGRITMTFDAADMQLATDGQTYTYALTDLQRLFFSSAATAIERVPVSSASVSLAGGDCLNVTLTESARLSVLSADGSLCLTRHLIAGSHTLPLGRLARGIYLVRINNKTFKISKP